MALVNRTSLSTPIYTGFGSTPWKPGMLLPRTQLRGCGCGPVGGCGCNSNPTLNGLGFESAPSSLDQIIASAANWLGGWAQSQLPASAAVPPQYGSPGAAMTQLSSWIPYIIGGIILYKLVK